MNFTEWYDNDGDGIGNNLDVDDDNDGIIDVLDAYPLDSERGLNNALDSDHNSDYSDPATVKLETAVLLLLLMFSFGVSVAVGALKVLERKQESVELTLKSEVELP